LITGNAAAEVTASSHTKASKKGAKGSAEHSAGLIHAPRKGEKTFSQLMSAEAGKNGHLGGASQLDPVEALKGALSAAVKAAHDAKNGTPAGLLATAAVAALSGHHPRQAGEAVAAGEKADGKKKSHALSLALALGAEAAQHAAKPGQAAGKEEQPAAQAAGAGPRQVSAQAAHAKVLVVDLRRRAEGATPDQPGTGPSLPQAVASDKASPALLLGRGEGREGAFDPLAKPVPAASAAHATPLERLRDMAGSELLRASTMVLRDGGGEIRLVLKPESLGSVRIRMNVVDNSIDGKIIVDNASVKQVFDGNIDALKRALTAEGFQMGSLQVSVGGHGADEGRQGQGREKPAAVRRVAAEDFQRNIPGIENLSLGELMVNLFV
jgi:flagellar hook-length control protein FliK